MDLHPNPERIQSLVQGMSPSWRSLLRHVTNCPKCGELFCDAVGEASGVPEGVLPWRLHDVLGEPIGAEAGSETFAFDLPAPNEPVADCGTDDLIEESLRRQKPKADADEPEDAGGDTAPRVDRRCWLLRPRRYLKNTLREDARSAVGPLNRFYKVNDWMSC